MNVPETIRPHDRRFAPCETVKRAVRVEWVNTDRIARLDVESGSSLHIVAYDRHGYPAS